MSKDQLIEEIGEIVAESISALLAPSTDGEYSRVKREISNRLIARIGKAYADGMKLPGEKWRGWGRFRIGDEVPYFMRGYLGIVEIDSQIKPPPGLEYNIIAYCKEPE